jgi:hypothetical protein
MFAERMPVARATTLAFSHCLQVCTPRSESLFLLPFLCFDTPALAPGFFYLLSFCRIARPFASDRIDAGTDSHPLRQPSSANLYRCSSNRSSRRDITPTSPFPSDMRERWIEHLPYLYKTYVYSKLIGIFILGTGKTVNLKNRFVRFIIAALTDWGMALSSSQSTNPGSQIVAPGTHRSK